MANQEHLAILKQGIDNWNKWRREQGEVQVDLSGTDLSDLDLSLGNFSPAEVPQSSVNGIPVVSFIGLHLAQINCYSANLQSADFNHANLAGASFRGAHLAGTNFAHADLFNVDLSFANIHYTNFSWTNMAGANFTGAEILWASFAHTHFSQSDMSQTTLGWNTFTTVELATVKGLDTVQHSAPSSLDIYTLSLSQGKIPEIFLRGAGVPQSLIEYAYSLANNPLQYYSCFIADSHHNEDFAKRLYADLQAQQVRCWFAPHDMKIGAKIRPTIDQAINQQDKLLLLLSEHALDSTWIEDEVEAALEYERCEQREMLFPVRLDDSVMHTSQAGAAKLRRTRHIGDFTRWKDHDHYQVSFDQLIRDLKKANK